jgi:hypothetical protein
MFAKKICLRAVMTNREGKRIWTVQYGCSICDLPFRPDPTDPGKLSLDFSTHPSRTSVPPQWTSKGTSKRASSLA